MPEAILFEIYGLSLDREVPVFEAWRKNFRAFAEEISLETYASCVGSDFGAFNPTISRHPIHRYDAFPTA